MKKRVCFSALLLIISTFLCSTSALATEYDELAKAARYDGREEGIITPVRDQGASSLCWAYAAISASEASVLKSGIAPGETALTLRLSPTQLGYARHNRGADPLQNTSGEVTGGDWFYDTGNSSYAPALFSQWCAPVSADFPENCNGWDNAAFRFYESLTLSGTNLKTDEAARLEIKKAIIKYGAVTFSYNNVRESYYYNPSGESGSGVYPHACTIIGWDDTIPSDSFAPGGATQNGGWLVKNSYSSLPFFYLSYDNGSSNIYAFSFSKKEKYDYNYFYDSDVTDFGLGSVLRPKGAANIFEAKKGSAKIPELISAVNVGFEGNNTSLKIKIYTGLSDTSNPLSGTLAAEEDVYFASPGYRSIELSKPVKADKGTYFSVVAEITNGNNSHFKLTQNQGKSFLHQNGVWTSVPYAPRIKVQTCLSAEKISFGESSVVLFPDRGEKGIFLLGKYRENTLEDLRMFIVPTDAEQEFPIPSQWKTQKGITLKGFFWESAADIKPICYKKKEES